MYFGVSIRKCEAAEVLRLTAVPPNCGNKFERFHYFLILCSVFIISGVLCQESIPDIPAAASANVSQADPKIDAAKKGILDAADAADAAAYLEIIRLGVLNNTDSFPASLSYPSNKPPDETRKRLPRCSLTCEDGWISDKWCDEECNNAECDFDGGDCEGWCGSNCRPGWPGDGQCDISCYKEECSWDGGDCRNFDDLRYHSNFGRLSNENFNYSLCKCPEKMLGDDKCDLECNTFECNQDARDCFHDCDTKCPLMWMSDGVCDQTCDSSQCYYDKGDCESCADNCRSWMIGNGVCDYACLNDSCNFDGGDCEGIASVDVVDYNQTLLVYVFCAEEFIGDGHCDLQCFNPQALWDAGDCGPPSIEAA